MSYKERPLGGDSQGPEVSRRLKGSTAFIVPREADVVNLDAWRRLRRAPVGGDWWGDRAMWTWDAAERSRTRWPA